MKKMSDKRVLKSLRDISSFTGYVENPELIVSLIIEECILLTNARWGAILTYDRQLNIDSFCVTRPLSEDDKNKLSRSLDSAVRQMINENGKRALKEDFWSKKDIQHKFIQCLGPNIRCVRIWPISKKGELLGVAVVADKKDGGVFSSKDTENLGFICQEASIVLDNIYLFKTKLRNERLAAIGQTLAGISHCIKNILQGITSASYLLSSGIDTNDIGSIKTAWSVVEKNTKRISDLVMDMLYYSKDRKPIPADINPDALIDDVVELVRPMVRERGIEIFVEKNDLPDLITGDEKGLHRCILNLVLNAADACDKKESRIDIKASMDKISRSIVISVADNGKGMSKETLSKIFQPFYSEKSKGTGLGLSITDKIVKEHGGLLKVDSELGKGTSFEMVLPIGKTDYKK